MKKYGRWSLVLGVVLSPGLLGLHVELRQLRLSRHAVEFCPLAFLCLCLMDSNWGSLLWGGPLRALLHILRHALGVLASQMGGLVVW